MANIGFTRARHGIGAELTLLLLPALLLSGVAFNLRTRESAHLIVKPVSSATYTPPEAVTYFLKLLRRGDAEGLRMMTTSDGLRALSACGNSQPWQAYWRQWASHRAGMYRIRTADSDFILHVTDMYSDTTYDFYFVPGTDGWILENVAATQDEYPDPGPTMPPDLK